MITVRNLSKRFGRTWALRDLDLDVASGQFLTIFGPNGAGKTTLIRILSTVSKPTAGTVTLDGLDLRESPIEARRQIGVVSHQTFLYDDLTAEENLRFYGRMYDVHPLEPRVDEVLSLVGLDHRRFDRVRTFSRGMQQRLAIARAIIHDPGVMLLDEPYTGLDPQAADMLRGVLSSLARQRRTVVMTTHNLERGLELCDQVSIIVGGRLAYQGQREELDVESLREVYRGYVALD